MKSGEKKNKSEALRWKVDPSVHIAAKIIQSVVEEVVAVLSDGISFTWKQSTEDWIHNS